MLSACGSDATPTPEANLFESDAPEAIIAQGRLVPRQSVDIAFQSSGQVKDVSVSEGDSVKEGETIASLDSTEQAQALAKAQLAVQQAEVGLANAQHTYTALVGWSPSKAAINGAEATLANAQAQVGVAQAAYDKVSTNVDISAMPQSFALQEATNNLNKAQADLDALYSYSPDITAAKNNVTAAELALGQAKLDLEQAQYAVDHAALISPLDGTVTTLNVDVASSVAAGQPVATVADLSQWIVETDDLTELQVVLIKVGQNVKITFDALPDQTFNGKVENIASQFVEKRGDITYTVTISLDDADPALRWGMTASVEFVQ